jgi:hypothetical protein
MVFLKVEYARSAHECSVFKYLNPMCNSMKIDSIWYKNFCNLFEHKNVGKKITHGHF